MDIFWKPTWTYIRSQHGPISSPDIEKSILSGPRFWCFQAWVRPPKPLQDASKTTQDASKNAPDGPRQPKTRPNLPWSLLDLDFGVSRPGFWTFWDIILIHFWMVFGIIFDMQDLSRLLDCSTNIVNVFCIRGHICCCFQAEWERNENVV